MISFNCKPFFFLRNFLMNIYCKSGGAIYQQPPSITYIVLGALLGTESLSIYFSPFGDGVFVCHNCLGYKLCSLLFSGKSNFISDPITNFYLGLAAQWVIDNFLYFCWIVLKYLWSVILLSMVIWWHWEDPSVRRLQPEWRWWVAPLTFALNFLSAVHAAAKGDALTREGVCVWGRGNRKWATLQTHIRMCHLKCKSSLGLHGCWKFPLFLWSTRAVASEIILFFPFIYFCTSKYTKCLHIPIYWKTPILSLISPP